MISESTLSAIGAGVVIAPSLLLAILGLTSLIGRPLSERTIGRLTQVATVAGLLGAVAILALMLALDTRARAGGTGQLGCHPRTALSLPPEVRLRPPVGSVCDPVVHPLWNDRCVCERVPAQGGWLPAVLRVLRDVPARNGRQFPRRNHRNPLRGVGAGRAVVGSAGRVLPRASLAGTQRSAGLVGLSHCRCRLPHRCGRHASPDRCPATSKC